MSSTIRAWESADSKEESGLTFFLNPSIVAPDATDLSKDQLLIRVTAAAINPVDLKVPNADWFGRTFGMQKGARLGLDFSGHVVAKHKSVADFTLGDRVFGALKIASRYGSLGEFLIASRSECAKLPAHVNLSHAAGVGTAAGTAWRSLLPASGIVTSGSKIFINGGSGGVGTYAIQFARILGADITTTCSTQNVDLCKGLGAHQVWDYKKIDVLAELQKRGQVFDLAIDNVGAELHSQCHTFLKPSGTFVQVAANPNLTEMVKIAGKKLLSAFQIRNQRGFAFVMQKATHEDYIQFGQWLADGCLRVVVDQEYEMGDVPQAYEKLMGGHVKGKVIINIYKA